MGMSAGGSKGGPNSDINMTPMIDILLVLLIIFMVVQQSLQKGVSVQVPPVKKEENPEPSTPDDTQIVLEVKAGRQFFVNRQPVQEAQLYRFLYDTYLPRPRKVLFIKADENVSYGDVVFAVDTARGALGAGAGNSLENVVVGLVPRADATPVPGI